jgi:CubicO group peptidase (beta-lactamase class C family)
MLIDELSELIKEKEIPVFRLAVYEDGKEWEWKFQLANDCNNIYSISKNFTAAAVGILFDRGILTPDTKVRTLFEPINPAVWETIDERWNEITVRHLLTQTTGHGGMFLDMDCDNIFQYGTEDFLTKVLETPLVYDPGTQFAYTDSNFYLLSRVVAAATGETLQSFAARELLKPLMVQGWAWSTCPHGHAMGGTRLFIRVKDMLHFGRMLLDGGVYDGKRILSEAFVKEATAPQSAKSDTTFYGYSFWMRAGNPSFHCGGMLGQKIFVDRKYGRVIAWQALDKERKTDDLLNYLYKM